MKKSKSKYCGAVKTGDVKNVENVENPSPLPVPPFQKVIKLSEKTAIWKTEGAKITGVRISTFFDKKSGEEICGKCGKLFPEQVFSNIYHVSGPHSY